MAVAKTPMALFTYNRPKHAQLALETLSRCDRFDEIDLYVYCDGPKGSSASASVEENRNVVRRWQRQIKCEVIERDENLGLAGSIVTGTSELCAAYGRVIVGEDDLAFNRMFLSYMMDALDHYENRTTVYQISGYMFPVSLRTPQRTFFLPLSTTWGWATWERAWRSFDGSATGAREMLMDPLIRRAFDLDDSYPYAHLLEERLAGRNQSWGILWWWSVFKAGGLVLYPGQSLVWVGGFDGSGTHCRSGSQPNPLKESNEGPFFHSSSLVFPDETRIDEEALLHTKESLKAFSPRSRWSLFKSCIKTWGARTLRKTGT